MCFSASPTSFKTENHPNNPQNKQIIKNYKLNLIKITQINVQISNNKILKQMNMNMNMNEINI